MTSARGWCGAVGAVATLGRGTTPMLPGDTGRRKTPGRGMELSELRKGHWWVQLRGWVPRKLCLHGGEVVVKKNNPEMLWAQAAAPETRTSGWGWKVSHFHPAEVWDAAGGTQWETLGWDSWDWTAAFLQKMCGLEEISDIRHRGKWRIANFPIRNVSLKELVHARKCCSWCGSWLAEMAAKRN